MLTHATADPGPHPVIAVRALCDGAKDGVLVVHEWVVAAMQAGTLLVTPEAVRLELPSGGLTLGGHRDVLLRDPAGRLHLVREGLFEALFRPTSASEHATSHRTCD